MSFIRMKLVLTFCEKSVLKNVSTWEILDIDDFSIVIADKNKEFVDVSKK